jgi:hypothetical protein
LAYTSDFSHKLTLLLTLLKSSTVNQSISSDRPLVHTAAVGPFLHASFFTSSSFTKPNSYIYNSLPVCKLTVSVNDSKPNRVKISNKIYPYDVIENHHAYDLHPGGHWFPNICQAAQRLAIIICYRNREELLKRFLYHMHSFLKRQQLDYTIFVVNQHDQGQFNRAVLFNVGFIEAMKLYTFDCFIFHDVDLIPEDLRNIYKCGDQPRHM